MVHQPARRIQQYVLAEPQRLYAEVDRSLYRFHSTFIEPGQDGDTQGAEQFRKLPDDRQIDLIFERQRPDPEFPMQVRQHDDGIDQGGVVRHEQDARRFRVSCNGRAGYAYAISQGKKAPRDQCQELCGPGCAARK